LIERGDGDDHVIVAFEICLTQSLQHIEGYDGALRPWSERLFTYLDSRYTMPIGLHELPESSVPDARYRVIVAHDTTQPSVDDFAMRLQQSRQETVCRVVENTRVTSLQWSQDVRRIVLCDTPAYETGSVCNVWPAPANTTTRSLLLKLNIDVSCVSVCCERDVLLV
jgi:sulfite reductase alpha subunit-like flavoprotein